MADGAEVRRAREELEQAQGQLEDARIALNSAHRGFEYARRDFDTQLRLELRSNLELQRTMQGAFEKTNAAKEAAARVGGASEHMMSERIAAGDGLNAFTSSWEMPIALMTGIMGTALVMGFTQQFLKHTVGAHLSDYDYQTIGPAHRYSQCCAQQRQSRQLPLIEPWADPYCQQPPCGQLPHSECLRGQGPAYQPYY